MWIGACWLGKNVDSMGDDFDEGKQDRWQDSKNYNVPDKKMGN